MNSAELSNYIAKYWDTIRITDTTETKTSLGLPQPYYAPSTELVDGFSFDTMFYWDSYFIAQGLFGTDRQSDVLCIIENMFDLIRRFGMIPNSTSFSHLSRSQPPFLSRLVMQYIEAAQVTDQQWITTAYDRISEEYTTVWLGVQQPHIRQVHQGLSRYYDTNVLHILAEAESGWDYTTRFSNRCLDFLPVDLNSLLYGYEQDLAQLAELLGKSKDAESWRKKAEQRAKTITQLMWSDGFAYDYDYRMDKIGTVKSLAAYTMMFAKLATPEQAKDLVAALPVFETDHGLYTTNDPREIEQKQWAFPNGWAPLHYIVVEGLEHYGYSDDARRIAAKWVKTVADQLEMTGVIYEKYNVQDPKAAAVAAVYPDQHGFGWTNGVTKSFIDRYKL